MTPTEQAAFEKWHPNPRLGHWHRNCHSLDCANSAEWGIAYGREQERKRAAGVARSRECGSERCQSTTCGEFRDIAAEIEKGEA